MSDLVNKTLLKRLDLAAARMTIMEPFIAAVMTKLPRRVVPTGTAWTDGSQLAFSSTFCDPLNDDELFGLMLHEAMHVVLMHMWRRDHRDPRLFNQACDAVINRYIRSKNYKLPAGGVDYSWVTDAMDAEEVYAKLAQDPPPPSSGGSSGNSDAQPGDEDAHGLGSWGDKGDMRDATDQAQEADVRASIMTAAKMAKACGDKSALVERILGGGLESTVHWSDEVRAILTSSSRDDFTFARVNRRMLASGIYLPAMHSPAMDGLVIGFDTSGSVGVREANQIAAEIRAVVEDLNPAWVEVVYCDSQIAGVQRFERGEDLKLEVMGGGGTRFKPVFDRIEERGEPIAALIYFTDMLGPLMEIPTPSYPVVWANVYGRMGSEIPFGKEVRVHV
jgi:predicted metal-dependent peptidase